MQEQIGRNALAKRVESLASERGVATDRYRRWISFAALCGALDRGRQAGDVLGFAVKGGFAVELRLSERARTSKDIDLILRTEGDLVESFDRCLMHGFDRFAFVRKSIENRPNSTRAKVAVQFVGRDWGSIDIDLSLVDQETSLNHVGTDLLDQVGLTPFSPIPCLSVEFQIAQKFHAVSHPGSDGQSNMRYRDLVDIHLLAPLVDDVQRLHDACRQTFEERKTHAWPPTLRLEPAWLTPLEALCAELELPIDARGLVDSCNRLIAALIGVQVDMNSWRQPSTWASRIKPLRG